MGQITYANKVALNENPEIAAINKVSDDDMNEIKSVVNANYNNTIQITNSQPTDSDNKIWIDTGEIAQAHTEITNSYSTSTGLGYSANYINNLITDTISKLLPNNLIRFETVKLTESTTLAAFASAYKGTTCPTITGYTPWFCYEVLGTGESSVRGYTHVVNNNNLGCWITNFTNSSKTFSGVDFKVMYIKEV